jgi:hypothetical protein
VNQLQMVTPSPLGAQNFDVTTGVVVVTGIGRYVSLLVGAGAAAVSGVVEVAGGSGTTAVVVLTGGGVSAVVRLHEAGRRLLRRRRVGRAVHHQDPGGHADDRRGHSADRAADLNRLHFFFPLIFRAFAACLVSCFVV